MNASALSDTACLMQPQDQFILNLWGRYGVLEFWLKTIGAKKGKWTKITWFCH